MNITPVYSHDNRQRGRASRTPLLAVLLVIVLGVSVVVYSKLASTSKSDRTIYKDSACALDLAKCTESPTDVFIKHSYAALAIAKYPDIAAARKEAEETGEDLKSVLLNWSGTGLPTYLAAEAFPTDKEAYQAYRSGLAEKKKAEQPSSLEEFEEQDLNKFRFGMAMFAAAPAFGEKLRFKEVVSGDSASLTAIGTRTPTEFHPAEKLHMSVSLVEEQGWKISEFKLTMHGKNGTVTTLESD